METVLDMALSTVSSLDEAFTSGVPLLSEEVEAEHASSEKPDVERSVLPEKGHNDEADVGDESHDSDPKLAKSSDENKAQEKSEKYTDGNDNATATVHD